MARASIARRQPALPPTKTLRKRRADPTAARARHRHVVPSIRYKIWVNDDMEGAMHELAAQYSHMTGKPRAECKTIRQIVKECGVPKTTLHRYWSTPGMFENGKIAGVQPVLTCEDERDHHDMH